VQEEVHEHGSWGKDGKSIEVGRGAGQCDRGQGEKGV